MVDLGVVLASAGGAFAGGGLGATATLLVARLREKGARREEWYRRFQHVSGLVLSTAPADREAGLALLAVLLDDRLAGPGERRLAEALLTTVLATGPLGDLLAARGLDPEQLLSADAAAAPTSEESWRPLLYVRNTDDEDTASTKQEP